MNNYPREHGTLQQFMASKYDTAFFVFETLTDLILFIQDIKDIATPLIDIDLLSYPRKFLLSEYNQLGELVTIKNLCLVSLDGTFSFVASDYNNPVIWYLESPNESLV